MENLSIKTRRGAAKRLTGRRAKVLELLRNGWVSATDICVNTGYSDPRGYIRDLCELGYNITSKWLRSASDPKVRYKIYHTNEGGAQGQNK